MKSFQRHITIEGIILHRSPFRETSEILEILTENIGKITVIAKGIKGNKSKLTGLTDIMNQLDMELYTKSGSDWYILKSAELKTAHAYNTKWEHLILIQAALEIFRQLELSSEDWSKLHALLLRFIQFIKTINLNPIAIFWRFLLNMFSQLGIDLVLSKCCLCSKTADDIVAFSLANHGPVCRKCWSSVRTESLLQVSPKTAAIFKVMPSIGNQLDTIDLDPETIKEIDRILLLHLSEHFQKNFHLHSLELYTQPNI